MNLKSILALITKDLTLFSLDRKALILTVAVPIAIASFFGNLTSPKKGSATAGSLVVGLVNQDDSPVTLEIVTNLLKETAFKMEVQTEEEARQAVVAGKLSVAVQFKPGFGEASLRSLFGPQPKPEVNILHDPSRNLEVNIVKGLLTQHIMQVVTRRVFSPQTGRDLVQEALANLPRDNEVNNGGGAQSGSVRGILESVDRWMAANQANPIADGNEVDGALAKPRRATRGGGAGLAMPFETKTSALTRKEGATYNGYAHSFGGMGVQFVLMYAIEAAMALLLERRGGMWRRLRSAPLSKASLLLARIVSCAAIGLLSLGACWLFAILVFHVHVEGSWIGFILANVSYAIFAGTVALFLASLGKTPEATRGLSIFAVLMMVMLGGAWIPSFMFPDWLQKVTLVMPTRWAVDVMDAMTWRGLGLNDALPAIGVLLGYSIVLGIVSVIQFRWEGE